MKKTISLLAALFLAGTGAFAQTLTEGSLDVLTEGARILAAVDFSEARIMGMDETSFMAYESDWAVDKPDVKSRLLRTANTALAGKLFLGDYAVAKYILTVKVLEVSETGSLECEAVLTDLDGNVLARIGDLIGPGGVIGTKMKRIKVGAKSAGLTLGIFLNKAVTASSSAPSGSGVQV